MKKTVKSLRTIFGSLYFYCFVSGFLVALFLIFKMQDNYETRLYSSLAQGVIHNSSAGRQTNEDSLVLNAMHTTHQLLTNRANMFKGGVGGVFWTDVIHASTVDMMTANGACGSYSIVLGRLLKSMGFTVRIPQMTVKGNHAGHILVEVYSNGQWVVMDALYDLYFVKPDGSLASFADVSGAWNYYKAQVPAGYDPDYSYAGVQYTNWSKIPVLGPAAYRILSLFMSDASLQTFSIRSYVLRKYQMLDCLLLLLIVPFTLGLVFKILKFKLGWTFHWQRLPRPESRPVVPKATQQIFS